MLLEAIVNFSNDTPIKLIKSPDCSQSELLDVYSITEKLEVFCLPFQFYKASF